MYIILDTHLSCTQYLYHTCQKLSLKDNGSSSSSQYPRSTSLKIEVISTSIMSNSTISASLYHSQQYQSVKEKLPNHYIYLFPSRKFIQQKSSAVCSWTKFDPLFLCHYPFYYNPNFTDHLMGRLFYIAIFSIVLKFKNTENNTNTIMSFKHDEFDCV